MAQYDRLVNINEKLDISNGFLTTIDTNTFNTTGILFSFIAPYIDPNLKVPFASLLSLDGLGVTTNIQDDFTGASADFEFTATEKTYINELRCYLRDDKPFSANVFGGLMSALGNGLTLIWKHPGETQLEAVSIKVNNDFFKWSHDTKYEDHMTTADPVITMKYTFRDQLVLETGESLTIRIGGAAGDNTTAVTTLEFTVRGFTVA